MKNKILKNEGLPPERYSLEGKSSRLLGRLGDYEINARWNWMIRVGKTDLLCVVLSSLLLAALVITSVVFTLHLKKVEKLELEVELLKKQLLEIAEILEQARSVESGRSKRAADDKGNRGLRGGGKDSCRGKKGRSRAENGGSVKRHVTAVHLEGSPGFFTSSSSGEIRSWIPSKWPEKHLLAGFRLEDQRSKLVVQKEGLYLIYAQMYYTTDNSRCSYEICVKDADISDKFSRVVAECSIGQVVNSLDMTCFTAVVHVLKAGDSVFLRQKQKHVNYSMGHGKSYLGLVNLSGS